MSDYSGDSLRRQFLGDDYAEASHRAARAVEEILRNQARLLLITKKDKIYIAYRYGQQVFYGESGDQQQIGAAYTESDQSITYEALMGNNPLQVIVTEHLVNGFNLESRDRGDDRRRTRHKF